MTGGRVKRLQSFIGNETVMLTYGDGLADINIDALLRSVKTKYAENKETREAINNLNESKLIKLTLEKRNSAAHADHSGLKKDFTEEDVKIMAKDLEIILFYLSNIHETIMAIEVNK